MYSVAARGALGVRVKDIASWPACERKFYISLITTTQTGGNHHGKSYKRRVRGTLWRKSFMGRDLGRNSGGDGRADRARPAGSWHRHGRYSSERGRHDRTRHRRGYLAHYQHAHIALH